MVDKAKFLLSDETAKTHGGRYDIVATNETIKKIVWDAIEEHGSNVNLNNVDVSNVTDMKDVFSLTGFTGDVSEWDVSAVTTMEGMFGGCMKFNGDISDWNVRSVTNFSLMFANCRRFNCDLSKWDIDSATTLEQMFTNCHNFNVDLGSWNVSGVKNMSGMFQNCLSFEGKGLSKWNVENVENIEYMFKYCKDFKEDLHEWNLKSCTKHTGFADAAPLFTIRKRPMLAV